MNQSVYKRDFRDPRDIASLWKSLLNENLKSTYEHNEEDAQAIEELSIKCPNHENEIKNESKKITKTESNINLNEKSRKNVMKAMSMMIIPNEASSQKGVRKFKEL